MSKRIVIGISGASGSIYADQILVFLKKFTNHQVEIIATNNGKRILREEINKDIKDYDYPVIPNHDYNNCSVSGSSVADQMIIVPASMGCIARVAHGISSDTLTRTADVFLKEEKKLIIVPRETPFSLIHLKNLTILKKAGSTIIPAIPSFYSQPKSIDELAKTVTSRILDHMGIENDLMKRWQQS
jgi:4-hydroxy-3-polyprenylbenzoate decarboxylase